MMEDKLTHDERLRLECVAQANVWAQAMAPRGRAATTEEIVYAAARIESYVREGVEPAT